MIMLLSVPWKTLRSVAVLCVAMEKPKMNYPTRKLLSVSDSKIGSQL